MHKIIASSKHPVTFEALEGTGNNASLAAWYRKADTCEGLLYLLEDDFLHRPEAVGEMCEAYALFSLNIGREVAIYPYYDPSSYNTMEPCQIVRGPQRAWRTALCTTGTVFLSVGLFKKYRYLFEALTAYGIDPKIDEHETINQMYISHQEILFTPLQSLAFNMQGAEPVFDDWRTLWNEYA